MPEVVPLTGVVVPSARLPSVRDIRACEWDQDTAWKAAVELWLTSVESEHSKAAYRRDIALWRRWSEDNGVPLDNARRPDADAWRDSMTAAPATIARRLAAVSSFYGYWLAEGIVERNPAQNAKRPKVSSAPVSIRLTREQAASLLAHVDSLADSRPAVIVRLLAETGMRVGELTGATVADLSESGGHHVLTLTRKGGGTQQLPLAASTYQRVMAYLDSRAEGYILHVKRTERREGDGRMDRGYVRQLLRRIAREASLPPEVWQRMHPHVLRHSVATLLAADGVPVHEIQRLLGHASLQTTQRYIHHAESLDASPVYRMAQLLAK